MPKVVREDIDALNTLLTITIEREDYEPEFKKELNKMKDKGSFKGFRKGKTPLPFLKKMYGKGLLSEIVTDLLYKEIKGIMESKETNFVGQPIPAKDFKPVNFDADSTQPYSFQYEMGVVPQFELKGIGDGTKYDYYKAIIDADKVEERLMSARKAQGEQVESTDPIDENDMVFFTAVELDGDEPKADGWKTAFTVLVNRLTAGPVKDEIMSKHKGDKVRFNVFELEENTSREFVKKYLLNFTQADIDEGTETGEMYEGTIEKVTRQAPAEMNQEFFDKVFGEGEVYNEEEARDRIAKSMGGALTGQSDSLLYRDMRQQILDMNRATMPLPDDFIKRWLTISQEKKASSILNDYENFADGMRWDLIKNKLADQYEIEVTEEDIEQMAYSRVAGYFGGYYDPKMLEPIVKRMMENPESLNGLASDVLADKVFYKIKENISLNEILLPEEDLRSKYQDAIKQAEPQNYLDSEVVIDEEE